MQLDPLTVYLVLQADKLSGWIGGFCVAIPIVLFAIIITATYPDDEFQEKFRPYIRSFFRKGGIILLILPYLIYPLIPSTKTLAVMIIAPAIVNSSVVQQDIPELYSLGVEKLKEAMGAAPQSEKK